MALEIYLGLISESGLHFERIAHLKDETAHAMKSAAQQPVRWLDLCVGDEVMGQPVIKACTLLISVVESSTHSWKVPLNRSRPYLLLAGFSREYPTH